MKKAADTLETLDWRCKRKQNTILRIQRVQ